MEIDKTLISKLEHLARLELSDQEKEALVSDLNNILQMVAKMEELDTRDVEPLIYISEQVNILREDEVKHQVDKRKALGLAPLHNDDYFKVPKMIEG